MTQIPLASAADLVAFKAEQEAAVTALAEGIVDSKSQAVAGVGVEVGNLTGYNLGKWQQKASDHRLVGLSAGDSVTAGHYATNYLTDGYAYRLGQYLRRVFGDGGMGFYGLWRTDVWTASAGWSITTFGPFSNCKFVADDPTPTLTLVVVGDNVDILYVDGNTPTRADLVYTIDGGSPVTATTVKAKDNKVKAINVSLGSSGTHTVVVSATATGNLYIVGAAVYKGTTGFVWHDWALSGATSTSLTLPVQVLDAMDVLAPDLSTVCIGINDHTQQTPLVTYNANLTAFVTKAQLTGECLIIIPPDGGDPALPIPRSAYEDEMKSVAVAKGVPWLSIPDLWGRYADNAARMYDTIHPNPLGHADMATPIARLLKAS